jgi:toxin-antitoxin system PIN domain toxin
VSWLLDVNFLLASRWTTHADHEQVRSWLDSQQEFHTTPIVELGFLRVSLSPGYGASWADAHQSLVTLQARPSHRFLPDDVMATDSPESRYQDTTDAHLVSLAARHHLKLATLDMALISKPWAAGVAINPLPIPSKTGPL